ncbi:MAG: methylenetetrahydrofolate reductase [NAD(P)H] [Chitinispirillales bacterium]|nr:methylenetetrahydrofolate reductase [NAD(P)H] [Chitinispirillales bacterium]
MKVIDILNRKKTTLSFEFFPPKTHNGFDNLFETVQKLRYLSPSYVSVTYGAGGSTRENTRNLVGKIQKETGLTAVAHLTCVGHSKSEIRQILENYRAVKIENILALRGDTPKNMPNFAACENGFKFAGELVKFIKDNFSEMGIGVAGFPEGHPSTPNRLTEIDNLKRKVDNGADYVCTQLFFNNDDFYDFCERCEIAQINVPIIAGIMPITSLANMKRIAELSLGARIPAKLLKAVYRATNDDYVEKVGIHWAAQQVNDLIETGVRGIHFYTLNKFEQIHKICESIGLISSEQLEK